MVNSGLLILSGLTLVTAAVLVLFPRQVLQLSEYVNRTLSNPDSTLMKYRYILAVLLFISSYLIFRLALIFPQVGG